MPTWSAEPAQSVAAGEAVVLHQVEAGYEPGIPVVKGVLRELQDRQYLGHTRCQRRGEEHADEGGGGPRLGVLRPRRHRTADVTEATPPYLRSGGWIRSANHDVFGAMTVDENLKIGGYISKSRSRSGLPT